MFKRFLAVFLACMTLLVCLGGCGDTAAPADTGSEAEGTTAAELPAGTNPAPAADAQTEEETPAVTEPPVPHEPAVREGWEFTDVPAYTAGNFDQKKMNGGRGKTTDSEAEYVYQITATDVNDYNAYLGELTACGFVKEYENNVDNNLFAGFVKDGLHVYTYCMRNKKTVLVVRDPLSASLSEFNYTLPDSVTGDSVLYAYAIEGTGQLLLWHLPDNSWIINDGANSNVEPKPLFEFLCSHSGIDPQGTEELTVRLWYITHAHGDHATGVINMLNKYHARVKVERVMWNIPEQSIISTSVTKNVQTGLDSLMKTYYKDALFLKLHSGMEIRMGDVRFLTLMTQEDNLSKFISKEYTDFNSTSTVCMVYFGGTNMFLPGDMKNGSLDDFVCKVYKNTTYCAPLIQVAHHGYNSMKAWYALTLPKTQYAIFENTKEEGLKQGSGPTVYETLGPEKCFFTDKTWVFTVKDGNISVTSE